ncbi:MAG: hypothetical protein ABC585_05685 [Candidatus Methanosuratincola petrocarbonis]
MTTLCFGEYDSESAECQRCEVREACAVYAWFEGEECEPVEGRP